MNKRYVRGDENAHKTILQRMYVYKYNTINNTRTVDITRSY